MLVAKQKRKENIIEYILYLFQVEDLVRAFNLDMNLIETRLVKSYNVDEATSKEITDWYANLVLMMDKEGVRENGHLQYLINLIGDINQLHVALLESSGNELYVNTFRAVADLITDLKQKNKNARNDVDLGITAVYGFLLLKIQKKNISAETNDAIKRISVWLGSLAKLYREFEAGEIDI